MTWQVYERQDNFVTLILPFHLHVNSGDQMQPARFAWQVLSPLSYHLWKTSHKKLESSQLGSWGCAMGTGWHQSGCHGSRTIQPYYYLTFLETKTVNRGRPRQISTWWTKSYKPLGTLCYCRLVPMDLTGQKTINKWGTYITEKFGVRKVVFDVKSAGVDKTGFTLDLIKKLKHRGPWQWHSALLPLINPETKWGLCKVREALADLNDRVACEFIKSAGHERKPDNGPAQVTQNKVWQFLWDSS